MVFKPFKSLVTIGLMFAVFLLGGCQLTVLDPKGPVAEQQKDLINWSIGFMLFIVVVVFVLFTWIVVKYRDRVGHKGYDPEQEGSKWLEVLWTAIPIVIVIALAVPTVKTIHSLDKPPKATSHKDPLVIHATSVDWKWVFTYPKQNIETVNYINIPEDRPILFKITSADSMSSFWIPQLGGQEYGMAGMETKLYLQADHTGTYLGRNSNFTGKGMANQTFTVKAQTENDFNNWVKDTQSKAPKLTKDQYDHLMLPGNVKKMTFSSTHLKWVDHAKDQEYALKVRKKLGKEESQSH